MSKRISADTIARIRKMRAAGVSVPQIQRETGVGEATIYTHTIDVRPPPCACGRPGGHTGGCLARNAPHLLPTASLVVAPPVAPAAPPPIPAQAMRYPRAEPYRMACMLVADPFRERRVQARVGAGRGRV